jgi:hypothetical protein
MRSEYFDITGKVFTPRPADAEIPILEKAPAEAHEKIGVVRAWARYGTSPEAIKTELKRRGLLAGADALMDIQIGEDEKADLVFCGKVFTTKRNVSGTASAIVFTKDGDARAEEPARNPALYEL